jgi:hypothetical protein
MALSTNRKNRVLRAPATNDSCVTAIPGTDVPFRRDRVLRVPATTSSKIGKSVLFFKKKTFFPAC